MKKEELIEATIVMLLVFITSVLILSKFEVPGGSTIRETEPTEEQKEWFKESFVETKVHNLIICYEDETKCQTK